MTAPAGKKRRAGSGDGPDRRGRGTI